MGKKKCCICGAPIVGYENNPVGAMWLDEHDELERLMEEVSKENQK